MPSELEVSNLRRRILDNVPYGGIDEAGLLHLTGLSKRTLTDTTSSLCEEGRLLCTLLGDGRRLLHRPDGPYAFPCHERRLLASFLEEPRGHSWFIRATERGLRPDACWDPRNHDLLALIGRLAQDVDRPLGAGLAEHLRAYGWPESSGGLAYPRAGLAAPGGLEIASPEAALEVVLGCCQERRRRASAVFAMQAPTPQSRIQSSLQRMSARAGKTERPVGVPWSSLAPALGGGLWPGLYVLTGGTGSGKTAFAVQVALAAARSGTPVLYLSLELDALQMDARLLGAAAGLPWSSLWLGTDPAQLAIAAVHADELSGLPLHQQVAPPNGFSLSNLQEAVRGLRESYPEPSPGALPVLVVVDFLQLISSEPGVREDTRQRAGRVAYTAKALASEFNASILAVSSISRERYDDFEVALDMKKGKDAVRKALGPPSKYVGAGKEAGEIEYASDGVLALVKIKDTGCVCVGVAKLRAGPTSWTELQFDGCLFSAAPVIDLARPPPPPPPSPRPAARGVGTGGALGEGFDGDL